jgi:hypothetical protein
MFCINALVMYHKKTLLMFKIYNASVIATVIPNPTPTRPRYRQNGAGDNQER